MKSTNTIKSSNFQDLVLLSESGDYTTLRTIDHKDGEGVIGDFSFHNMMRGSFYSVSLNKSIEVKNKHNTDNDIIFTIFAKTGGGLKYVQSDEKNILLDGSKDNLDGLFIISNSEYSFDLEVHEHEYQLCYHAYVKREYFEYIITLIKQIKGDDVQYWLKDLLSSKPLFLSHFCSKDSLMILEDFKFQIAQNSDIELFQFLLNNLSLINSLIKDYNYRMKLEHHYLSRDQFHLLQNIKSQITKDYSITHHLNDIAKWFGINNEQIKYLFKKGEGKAFSKWYITKRLEESKLLLRHQIPLSEIAFRIGYSAPSHFIRAFKREYGMTPNQYKQNVDKR